MSDAKASLRFKAAAARGLLEAGLIMAVCTHVAAWVGLAVAFGLTSWSCVATACVSGVVAALALWLLIRLAIDRRLFVALECAAAELGEGDALAALDRALLELGWIGDAKAGRALDARVRGVARLVRTVGALAVVEVVTVVVAVLAGAF